MIIYVHTIGSFETDNFKIRGQNCLTISTKLLHAEFKRLCDKCKKLKLNHQKSFISSQVLKSGYTLSQLKNIITALIKLKEPQEKERRRNKKGFGYTIIETKDISELYLFKDHRRLSVFFIKGCTCVNCGKVGTVLKLGKQSNHSEHWDVYCEDGTGMTVDHIHPKSKGGEDHISNYQPMCQHCNAKKADKILDTMKHTYKEIVQSEEGGIKTTHCD